MGLDQRPNDDFSVCRINAAPVDAEGSTLEEPTTLESLHVVKDSTATEVAPPSSVFVEDEPVEANTTE